MRIKREDVQKKMNSCEKKEIYDNNSDNTKSSESDDDSDDDSDFEIGPTRKKKIKVASTSLKHQAPPARKKEILKIKGVASKNLKHSLTDKKGNDPITH